MPGKGLYWDCSYPSSAPLAAFPTSLSSPAAEDGRNKIPTAAQTAASIPQQLPAGKAVILRSTVPRGDGFHFQQAGATAGKPPCRGFCAGCLDRSLQELLLESELSTDITRQQNHGIVLPTVEIPFPSRAGTLGIVQ